MKISQSGLLLEWCEHYNTILLWFLAFFILIILNSFSLFIYSIIWVLKCFYYPSMENPFIMVKMGEPQVSHDGTNIHAPFFVLWLTHALFTIPVSCFRKAQVQQEENLNIHGLSLRITVTWKSRIQILWTFRIPYWDRRPTHRRVTVFKRRTRSCGTLEVRRGTNSTIASIPTWLLVYINMARSLQNATRSRGNYLTILTKIRLDVQTMFENDMRLQGWITNGF